ncbi:ABC transporter permease [Roseinatronobacter alkalisoli]|uniref:ABC transporter permease n=1 Tax=Roseinatronobacter alkalisoli TaxID=3028235 RepID=A0ABT5T723_9RHOB|nr:ABC transporter permease [Roseinatronobacter sp. HJB301]MDD7970930.1 ABC transporter permease [Roseinatronobacter sp. HJB301]
MASTDMTNETSIQAPPRKRRYAMRRVFEYPIIPVLLLLPMVVCGLFGPWIWPHDPTAINFTVRQTPPVWLEGGEWRYFLGTDQFGRDLLSRLIEGARIALIVSTVTVTTAAIIGTAVGMLAGYYGGIVDTILMRIVDVKMSIPPVLLTILIGAVLGGGLTTILVAIILVFWADYARVIRGETLALKSRGFVQLARVANASDWRIFTRHLLPNLLPTCIVLITLQFGAALVIEAAITFIGLGIQPPASAWGLLVADGRAYLTSAWWIPTFAGMAIALTALGANLLGDWLRDYFDPRLKKR